MSQNDRVAANLCNELKRQQLNAKDLAQLVGENPMWVSRRLSGQVAITVDDLMRLAEALDTDAAALIYTQRPSR